jgi:hypothetical protein
MQSIIVDESSGKSGGIVEACGNLSRDFVASTPSRRT